MIEDRKRFLHHAVRCYASCLQHGDTHDLHIFRLTSLWFDNCASPEVNEVLEVRKHAFDCHFCYVDIRNTDADRLRVFERSVFHAESYFELWNSKACFNYSK